MKIPVPWLSPQAHTQVYGKHVFPDTRLWDLDTPVKTRQNLFEKHVGLLRETETSKREFLGYARGVYAGLE